MIELVMAEFGQGRANCGNTDLRKYGRLEPTLSTMLKYFPELKVTLYTDYNIKIPNVEVKKVSPKFESHPRYGNRCNDYYKVIGMLDSKCDIVICMDSDMFVYSKDILDGAWNLIVSDVELTKEEFIGKNIDYVLKILT